MYTPTKITGASLLISIAGASFSATAENTGTGGGPIDFGPVSAYVYLGPSGDAAEGAATPPLGQQDLGMPATVSISGPSDGATSDPRVAGSESPVDAAADSRSPINSTR